jgi:O-acetyl-ADP-ribose deacetylase (regulator of RNase III)
MGVYAYPPEEAVPILVETTSRLAANFQHLCEVRFVVVSEALLSLFLTAIQRISVESIEHSNAGSQAIQHSEEKGK